MPSEVLSSRGCEEVMHVLWFEKGETEALDLRECDETLKSRD